MANHPSALKRAKEDEKRRVRNRSIRTFYRNRIRDCRQAIEEKNIEQAQETLKKAISAIDGAVTKNVIHRNTASRYVSRLTVAVRNLSQPKPTSSEAASS